METKDFDKLLREKILDQHTLHEKEMESAKPFVWSAVYDRIGRKRTMTWHHLAAAVILLLISFSMVLYSLQRNHQRELTVLSGNIDQLEDNYHQQLEQFEKKNAQLSSLNARLNKVVENVTDFQQTPNVVERVVVRTDTVYIKQVEYINATPESTLAENSVQSSETQISLAKSEGPDENNIDEIIYPSRFHQKNKGNAGSIKFKISPFTARRN